MQVYKVPTDTEQYVRNQIAEMLSNILFCLSSFRFYRLVRVSHFGEKV